MTAMGCRCADPGCFVGDKMIAYYEARAKGGAGLIFTEITRVNDEHGVGETDQLSVTKDEFIPGIKRLTDAVHSHGSKLFIQLHHPGRQTYSFFIGGKEVVAPSAIPCNVCQQETRALSNAEVKSLVQDFINGAVRAKKGGADGVELHGAHGYLVCQFLSPRTNKRTDEYGGNFENRCRFMVEIIKGIKAACGADYPVTVRLSVTECYEFLGIKDGITIEDGVEIAKTAEKVGADAISVSSGTYETMNAIVEPISFPQGWRNEYIKAVKKAVKVPVIAVGVFREPEYAEKLIEDGVLDFIGMGRTWLADSDWGIKALSGHPEDIRKCTSCLYCFEKVMTGNDIACSVNADLAREYEVKELKKDGAGRHVAVVGSGPAGLEAARILSLRGFAVTLYEKAGRLGGQVYLSSLPPQKERMGWLVDYEEVQLKKQGVEIHLNTSATAEILKELNPYAVVVATGSLPIMPTSIKGIDGKNVYQTFEVLSGDREIKGDKVVVVGSGLTGLETAEYLAERGKKVSVFEMQDRIGPDAYLQVLGTVTANLLAHAVGMCPSHKLVSIETDKAVFEKCEGGVVEIPCDAVVMSLGVRPNNTLEKDALAFCGKVFSIGDARTVARIAQAVSAGNDIGRSLE